MALGKSWERGLEEFKARNVHCMDSERKPFLFPGHLRFEFSVLFFVVAFFKRAVQGGRSFPSTGEGFVYTMF